jgi:hypothetical protein
MLLLIISIGIVEYARIKNTRQTMDMFTRIAGNYALTASQGSDDLVDKNLHATMYDKTEYRNYLNMLNQACVDATAAGYNCKSLEIAYKVLDWDYNRAISAMEYGYENDMDQYLEFTPLSFNLPYLSSEMTQAAYEYAMTEMVKHYSCKGRPSVFIDNGSVRFNTSDGSMTICQLDDNSAVYNYGDIGFNIVALDDRLIRSIYGNADYYNDKITQVFQKLDASLFEDYRYGNGSYSSDGSIIVIPQYNVTFTTPYYYITDSLLLAFGRNASFGGTDSSFVSSINGAKDVYCYNNSDSAFSALYDNDRVRDGQLMMYMSGGTISTASFTYEFVG